jgi:hypothetical protein
MQFGKIELENSIEWYQLERLRLLEEHHAEITALQCEIHRLKQDQESRQKMQAGGRQSKREMSLGESAFGTAVRGRRPSAAARR